MARKSLEQTASPRLSFSAFAHLGFNRTRPCERCQCDKRIGLLIAAAQNAAQTRAES